MEELSLLCIKCGKKYEYSPMFFTCTTCNNPNFTNLLIKDPNGKLIERDPFETEKTPCYKIPKLNHELGIPDLFIKDETFNSFGTMKDRRSKVIIKLAKYYHFQSVFCVTGGNLGNSLSEFAKKEGINCIAIAPTNIPKQVIQKLGKKSKLIKVESLYGSSQTWTAERVVEAFPECLDGTGNNPCAVAAYKTIVEELKAINPATIIVPLGSGELFCGICQGIEENGMQTKVIGVSISEKNPIGLALKQEKDEILIEKVFEERTANKIAGTFTPLLPIIIYYLSKGNQFLEITDKEMQDAVFEYQPYFEQAIETSSLSVFAALEKIKQEEKQKKIVCVLTGRNHVNEAIQHR